jgi:DNA-binding CsgD family transcriptional regulator
MPEFILSSRLNSLSSRKLSIAVFALFSAWQISFPYEGQVFYSLAALFNIDPDGLLMGAMTIVMAGLLMGGFFVRTERMAKPVLFFSILGCMAGSAVFFFKPSNAWTPALFAVSFLAGLCTSAWGFYFKSCTPRGERIKTAADVLIYSAALMIAVNQIAIYISPYLGLLCTIVLLGAALFLSAGLPAGAPKPVEAGYAGKKEKIPGTAKPLALLCVFIVTITITSGLMFEVVNPAFADVDWLVSLYWAVPYIAALIVMKVMPRTVNRTFLLFAALAMIGFSFIAFMVLDRSVQSYLIINTLLLGACGVNDLFWWSILGEMLDLGKNPARILGFGLAANILGVLTGELIGQSGLIDPSLAALTAVCAALVILPPLHKYFASVLKGHVFLTGPSADTDVPAGDIESLFGLTGRESQIVALLRKGYTYRMIASELFLSENTVKTHIQNIYYKLDVSSRADMIKKLGH